MPDHDNHDDKAEKKVKDLLDASTRAELERWFGMPSFEQLAEQGVVPQPPAEDAETAALRKRRDSALAAVDPALIEAVRLRVEPPRELLRPRPPVKIHADPSIARLDQTMIERLNGVAEPRQIELPLGLDDDLRDCTPQALLRDLHRPELDFDKQFEVVDVLADYRNDATTIVGEVMGTQLRLPPADDTPFQKARALLLELRAERRQPWTDIKMPLRRVTE
ncbi:MAG TPA: hypothetical protein VGD37_40050 [Kofleriaceae bacterium]|jgi:hypothetical protein